MSLRYRATNLANQAKIKSRLGGGALGGARDFGRNKGAALSAARSLRRRGTKATVYKKTVAGGMITQRAGTSYHVKAGGRTLSTIGRSLRAGVSSMRARGIRRRDSRGRFA